MRAVDLPRPPGGRARPVDEHAAAYRRDLRRYVGVPRRPRRRGPRRRDRGATSATSWRPCAAATPDHPPLSASSAGRTLVAVRGFHRFAVREGIARERPGGRACDRRPRRSGCRRRSRSATSRRCWTRPRRGRSPVGRCATGRCSRCSTARGARISEAVGLDVDDLDLDGDGVRAAARQGLARSGIVPVGSVRPRRRSSAYLVRARPSLRSSTARIGGSPAAVFLNARGGRLSRQSAWAVARQRPTRRADRRGLAAHAAALLRHPPARGRRRRPRRPGAARARLGDHDADLHAGHRRPPARGLRGLAPARPLTLAPRATRHPPPATRGLGGRPPKPSSDHPGLGTPTWVWVVDHPNP